MGINVKNDRVESEIRLLADRLGIGLTEAIEQAVRAHIHQLDTERDAEIQRKLAAIDAIVAGVRPLIPPGATSSCDEFYDENGLPA